MRRAAFLVAAAAALAGCATLPPPRYYSLSGAAPPAPVPEAAAYRVAVGPARLPEAIDRNQLVLRISETREQIRDNDRWAASLKHEIPRVLAEAVQRRLPAARVTAHELYSGQDADYRVWIDVARFEAVPGKAVTLDATWTVRNRAGEPLREVRSVVAEKVAAPGVDAIVTAHRQALTALADEIAAAIRALADAKR